MGKKSKQVGNHTSPKTILVVDDEENLVLLMSAILQQEGYAAISANSGEEAVAAYAEAKPDLVLTDIHMPEINGMELIKIIRKQDQNTPIITLTGFASLESMIEAYRLGADEFLVKPFKIDELLSIIEELLSANPAEFKNRRLERLILSLEEENQHLQQWLEGERNKTRADEAKKHQEETFDRLLVHDMNNELAQIGGALRAIRKLSAGSDEIQEECDSIERSLHYFGQLLQRAKNRGGIGMPSSEPIGVPELIRRAESLIRPRIPSNIKFEVTADPNTSEEKVLVDAEQIIGVLLELTNNAVHALRNREGVIKLDFIARDKWLFITVSNNGPSISEELREKLFRERVHSSREKGMGMGLMLAKNMLEIFGGSISLQQSPPPWTVFAIRLPLYEP
jgi:DNA-binding response OmpR family regulator